MSQQVVLVVDSAAIIRGVDLHEISDTLWTVSGVMEEIRDPVARSRLEMMPFELKIREPSKDAMVAVTTFAKLTGDLGSLSAVDLKVIALTYDFEREVMGGIGHINTTLDAFAESQQPAAETAEAVVDNASSKGPDNIISGEGLEDDGEGEWIGPENIQAISQGYAGSGTFKELIDNERGTEKRRHVACITGDYSMQNVLLQMGMEVVAPDGLRVRHLKKFVAKCHACREISSDLQAKFCPKCGHQTLMKVSEFVDEHGVRHYSKGIKKFNLRGTKFPLPQPRGGRWDSQPVLTQDMMPGFGQVRSKKKQSATKEADQWLSRELGASWDTLDPRRGKEKKGAHKGAPYWTRRNPNATRSGSGRSKRKGSRNLQQP